jgi:dihydrofolate synthase/folylpolyglutamate synthase
MNVKAEERIRALRRFGSKPGLSRMRALMSRLGNPERGLRVIHIAGTNGKGSVCRYIYEGLRANGYAAGLFASPFMTDFRDAIIRNDEVMSRASLDTYTERIFCAVDDMCAEGLESPTEFEVITALALLFFFDAPVDFVVLEVGLGGKEDSTNIIDDCLLSVITSVSLDHCAVLGDTVEAIAAEKAGIIKPGRPVVNGASGAAKVVVEQVAREKGCELFDTGRIPPVNVETHMDGTTFDAQVGRSIYERLRLSMIGGFQAENAMCALCAFDILKEVYGFALDETKLREGMFRATLPGRFERIDLRMLSQGTLETSALSPSESESSALMPSKSVQTVKQTIRTAGESSAESPVSPVVVLDGAHNPDGMKRLAETIETLFPNGRVLTVFAALKDKNIEEMLTICAGFSERIIVTETDYERKADAEDIVRMLRGIRSAHRFNMPRMHDDASDSEHAHQPDAAHMRGDASDSEPAHRLDMSSMRDGFDADAFRERDTVIANPLEAVAAALDDADSFDLILVTGSLYLVREIRGDWRVSQR